MKGLADANTHYEFDDVNTMVISIPANALNGLQNNPNIVEIYPDSKTELTAPVDEEIEDSFFTRRGRRLAQSSPYGIDMLDVNWLKKKGEGIKVCVLDTGYTKTHEDLPSFVDWAGNGLSPANPPVDTDGHGTHVAGTIAALDNDKGVVGVSPGVGVVVGPYLAQTTTYISSTIDGIRKCRDKGAKVVNMSFGSCSYSPWQKDQMDGFHNNDDMLLVATAGNHGDGKDRNGDTINPNLLRYPASYPAVVSVASVDSDGVRASHSGKNNDVDIAAPGVRVMSTTNNGSYGSKSGTSMASPHVAGVAARVWSIMPWLTAPQLRLFLKYAAQYEYQAYTGPGLVNTGFYTIMLQRSGKCLDNYGGWVGLYNCGIGYTDQQFTHNYFNNMIVGSNGKCVRLSGSYNGASVTYTTCNVNDGAQKWTYTSNQFKNAGGYCLNSHSSITMWSCNGGSNQKWLLGKNYETRLFQDSDMYAGGKMYRTPGAGRWGSMPIAVKNDRLTRTIIPQGFVFEYYEHTNFGGWNNHFGLHDFSINLNLGGHNDSVSSFVVRKLPDGKVKLCKHSDCLSYYFDCTWVKNYSSMPSEIGNDQLTRVLIPCGYQFQYFEDSNFRGWSSTFGSCNNGINLSMGGHNDAVSSFKIKVLNC